MSVRPEVPPYAGSDRRRSWLGRLDDTGVPLMLFRLVVGGWMLYLAGRKVLAPPADFLKVIRDYRMLPEGEYLLMNTLAAVLPYVEFVVGLLLVLGVALRGSALLTLLMLMVFTPVIALRAMHLQTDTAQAFCDIAFDCGCGSGVQIVCHKLLENAGLIGLTIMILLTRTRRWCLKRDLVPREHPHMTHAEGSSGRTAWPGG